MPDITSDDPQLAFFDLSITDAATARNRYAVRLKAPDADGHPRCLALTWDGQWLVLNPETSAVRRTAGDYAAGQVARRVSTGKVLRRADSNLLLSSPPQTRWIAMAEDGGKPCTLRTTEVMEDVS